MPTFSSSHIKPHRRITLQVIRALLLLTAAVFLVLHAFHLTADFPNYSPWMDWSKYTDEGWYGDAAIRHHLLGHWYLPGDFNPAAALPVWPLLESAVFHFTGVSALAARALTVTIFTFILVLSYVLLLRHQRLAELSRSVTPDVVPNPIPPAPTPPSRTPIFLAPAIAVLLLAVNPFCFVFTRIAILEPMLILLTLLALFTASYATNPRPATRTASSLAPIPAPGQGSASPRLPKTPTRKRLLLLARQSLLPVALGLLITLMVLTKTTALFLLPAVAWILFARAGYRLLPFLRIALPAIATASVTWLAYFFFLIRPHFLDDFRYLFSANAYTGITADSALATLADTISSGVWIGRLLYPLALLAILVAVLRPRRSLRNPLIPALLFWVAGYLAFLAYHNNLQPRYYLVVAIPLTLLAPLVFEDLWRTTPANPAHPQHPRLTPIGRAALVVGLLAVVTLDARQTLRYVLHPEYTYATAAAQIRDIITASPDHSPLLLSISGSDLSLMTGLPSICDDFGTMELPARVKAYRPGWYLAWNEVEDDKMDALAPLYHLTRIASFPVMDDPERNLLILYRLDPATPGAVPHHHHRKPTPRLLQTSLGQQPSTPQLQH
jgi:hypothetical protein